jgi:hypothetical protein
VRVTQESADVNEAVAGELRLMDPDFRSSGDAARLIDPEFVEVGAQGPRSEPPRITGVLLARYRRIRPERRRAP